MHAVQYCNGSDSFAYIEFNDPKKNQEINRILIIIKKFTVKSSFLKQEIAEVNPGSAQYNKMKYQLDDCEMIIADFQKQYSDLASMSYIIKNLKFNEKVCIW